MWLYYQTLNLHESKINILIVLKIGCIHLTIVEYSEQFLLKGFAINPIRIMNNSYCGLRPTTGIFFQMVS